MNEPTNVKERLDEIDERVMGKLMPFQRASVEHIESLYKDGYKRVLLADEVGLGKTLVARGVIAKIAKLRRSVGDPLVKVAYVCSNASIARQNLDKLKIDADVDLADSTQSRLSMQHFQLAKEKGDTRLKDKYIQLIPLTPATSFQTAWGWGIKDERALLFAMMLHMKEFQGPENRKRRGRLKRLLQGNAAKNNWENACEQKKKELQGVIRQLAAMDDADDLEDYPDNVLRVVREALSDAKLRNKRADRYRAYSLQEMLDYLDGPFDSRSRDSVKEVRITSCLRQAFSVASTGLMQPDFVIMDEFQRFHSLLRDDDTEVGLLVKAFFGSEAYVLLLSATPFRMYSTGAEQDDDDIGDSHNEFMQLIGFLSEYDASGNLEFRKAWTDYSNSLFDLVTGKDELQVVVAKREAAQERVSKYVSRTERTSTNELGGIVRGDVDPKPLAIEKGDIEAYLNAEALAKATRTDTWLLSVDYAKSCPWMLSFMRGDYKFSKELRKNAQRSWDDVKEVFNRGAETFWLPVEEVNAYHPLDVQHARYKAIKQEIFGNGNPEQLLWVPPSIPYYKVPEASPFFGVEHFSKMLVFSSWGMVPLALSTMLSYEAEQRNVQLLEQATGKDYRYFKSEEVDDEDDSDTTTLPHRRLRLADSRVRGNAFPLVFPSRYMAKFDIRRLASRAGDLERLRADISRVIERDFRKAMGKRRRIVLSSRACSPVWCSRVLLKLEERYGGGVDLLEQLAADSRLENNYRQAIAALRIERDQYANWSWDAREIEIPHDVFEVLADIAIGSPAVCAMRAYKAAYGGKEDLARCAFEFGYSFITKMNTAAATTAIEACMVGRGDAAGSEDVHWRRVLRYCCEGNFQSMLDEYVHLMASESLHETHSLIIGTKIGNDNAPSLNKADVAYDIATQRGFEAEVLEEENRPRIKMRTNFASGFMDGKKDGARSGNRSDLLRKAFNSPFRPFVLISTSIGQEGLDFHQYCRKIVHWNLPSNPVDFEQREGRINRYKSLAIRQTLAQRYGRRLKLQGNVWDQLFEIAKREELKRARAAGEGSGLLPYWGVTEGKDMVRIERIVYNYPFSKDEGLYKYLLETMAQYRAVLGQPNQEELIALIERRFEEDGNSDDIESRFRDLFMNLCPFAVEGGDSA